MGKIKRTYGQIVKKHLASDNQMIFLVGPRRVGKTTLSRRPLKGYTARLYLNWDNDKDRAIIIEGTEKIAELLGIKRSFSTHTTKTALLVLDEIHKSGTWQNWLKGFYDVYHNQVDIIVTGSAKLDVYRRGGDSMMGRYFLYHIHPLSVAELLGQSAYTKLINPPKRISRPRFERLLRFGGFPEPYLRSTQQFHTRWKKLRNRVVFTQEIRDLTRIEEVARFELLAKIITLQVSKTTSNASLSKFVGVDGKTIPRWIESLNQLYYIFSIKPWHKNVMRSLLKEGKHYVWDWSAVKDDGARHENFIASHLLKAVHYWNDIGHGDFGLHYVRDRLKREVDFLVTRDDEPWFLVEVKTPGNNGISPALKYFHKRLKTQHAFQVTFDEPYTDVDCFSYNEPVIVPAATLLTQLV